MDGMIDRAAYDISIHALLAESDYIRPLRFLFYEISIHALLAESDKTTAKKQPWSWNFYPRSPCGERRISVDTLTSYITISIHALLAESDVVVAVVFYCRPISIHALLAESDLDTAIAGSSMTLFLSTLSLRRATLRRFWARRCSPDFYPRSPCGERPRERAAAAVAVVISIHALLAESDRMAQGVVRPQHHFYPRSPCGERREREPALSQSWAFLSTLSLRRATCWIPKTVTPI